VCKTRRRNAIERNLPLAKSLLAVTEQGELGGAHEANRRTAAPPSNDAHRDGLAEEFSPPGGREASKILEDFHVLRGAPAAAFVYAPTTAMRWSQPTRVDVTGSADADHGDLWARHATR
jgi:hypothetical protein